MSSGTYFNTSSNCYVYSNYMFCIFNSIFQKAKEQNSIKEHWCKSTILHFNDIFLLGRIITALL